MAIFGNKDKAGNFVINFVAYDGLPNINKGLAVSVTMESDSLLFRCRIPGNKNEVRLPYSKIIELGTADETKIEEVKKSVVGRALVGGGLFGPLGAIVGAIDGTGKKQKSSAKYFVVIGYEGDNGVGCIRLEIVGSTMGFGKFMQRLAETVPALASTQNEPSSIPQSVTL